MSNESKKILIFLPRATTSLIFLSKALLPERIQTSFKLMKSCEKCRNTLYTLIK